MKNLRGKFSAKITAVILLCVMVLVFTFSIAGIIAADDMELYSGSYEYAYQNKVSRTASNTLHNRYYNYFGGYYYNPYELADTNILTAVYENGAADIEIYNPAVTQIQWAGFFFENEQNYGRIIGAFYTNEQFEEMLKTQLEEHDKLAVAIVPQELTPSGRLYESLRIMKPLFDFRYVIIAAAIISFIFGVLLFIFLMYSAGYKGELLRESFIDRLPYDIFTFVMACVFSVAVALLLESISSDLTFMVGAPLAVLCILAGGLALLLWFMSTAVRVRCKTLLKNTLIYRVLHWLFGDVGKKLRDSLGAITRNMPFLWKYAIIIGIILLAEFLYICRTTHYYARGSVLFLWFIERFVLTAGVVYVLLALERLRRGIHAIAAGNESNVIKTDYLKGDFLRTANELNNIHDGLSRAVDERMKSERFKTELITNVSHDIKTPLTSVINYTDLLAREEPENEKMREYIEVISRQSAKLKKLIDDLIEASKASSGVLKTELVKTDLSVLIEQTEGEYAEKLQNAGLEFIVEKPQEPLFIMADSRHIWRVFDNLMNNILKYAQPGTRVYLSALHEGSSAMIVFRNISREPLNISSDKLMERFVRGDASRHTSGSGLGLSIANSLTELQGGTLSLTVDGDLFKVTLKFETV